MKCYLCGKNTEELEWVEIVYTMFVCQECYKKLEKKVHGLEVKE